MKMYEFYPLIEKASRYTSKDTTRGGICYVQVVHNVGDHTTTISATDGYIVIQYREINDTDYNDYFSILVDAKLFLKSINKEDRKRGLIVNLHKVPQVKDLRYPFPCIENGFPTKAPMNGEITHTECQYLQRIIKAVGACSSMSGLIKISFDTKQGLFSISAENKALQLSAKSEGLKGMEWVQLEKIGFNYKYLYRVLSDISDKKESIRCSITTAVGPMLLTSTWGTLTTRCCIMPLRIFE
jgi:DNA polymerase III sliding clamp (beta) subunit (PCNA family)|tara:strand:- start:118 stop:840 length:723 start_codon:yes stop_codon:yes gene_type:complete